MGVASGDAVLPLNSGKLEWHPPVSSGLLGGVGTPTAFRSTGAGGGGGGELEEEEEAEEVMSARAETFNNILRTCTRELRHSSFIDTTGLVSIANERTN